EARSVRPLDRGEGDAVGAARRGTVLRQGPLRGMSPRIHLHRRQDARPAGRGVLQRPRPRLDQILLPAGHQGLTAVPARWTTADSRGHRRVLQSDFRVETRRLGEIGPGGLPAATLRPRGPRWVRAYVGRAFTEQVDHPSLELRSMKTSRRIGRVALAVLVIA